MYRLGLERRLSQQSAHQAWIWILNLHLKSSEPVVPELVERRGGGPGLQVGELQVGERSCLKEEGVGLEGDSGCFFKGPGFDCQHPHGSSQPS